MWNNATPGNAAHTRASSRGTHGLHDGKSLAYCNAKEASAVAYGARRPQEGEFSEVGAQRVDASVGKGKQRKGEARSK